MDNNDIFNFEEHLKALKAKKCTGRKALYENSVKDTTSSLKLEDVMLDVSRQIQAIQNADCSKRYQKRLKKSDLLEKSEFVPVNVLANRALKQDIQNKFDTQCVSDTQLIHLVENAETLATNTGVTQEFDITFCHKPETKSDQVEGTQKLKELDTDLNSANQENSSKVSQEDNKTSTKYHTNSPTSSHSKIAQKGNNVQGNLFTNSSSDNQKGTKLNTNKFLNIVQSTPENSDTDDIIFDPVEKSCEKSPILNRIEPIVMKNSQRPLVYKLDAFEKFEALALPVIEEHPDLRIAKKIINSQIANSELCIDTHNHILQNRELSKSPILSVNSRRCSNSLSECKNTTPKNNELLIEDEILFSSDEENYETHKSVEDLPLTCALETSFYNQTGVLDKTMYVGFQTASNKSIQVHTDSFIKAKNVLDTSGMDLTDLVKVFDNSFIGNKLDKESGTSNYENSNIEQRMFETEKSNDHYTVGFQTANGKSIGITNNALVKSKALFQDIENDFGGKIESFKITDLKKKILEDVEAEPPKRVKYNNETDLIKTIENEISVEEEFKINDDDIINEFENSLIQETQNDLPDQIIDSKILRENVSNEAFQGFKTASYKPIKVSDEAMARTRKILEDFDFDLPTNCGEHKSKSIDNRSHLVKDASHITKSRETKEYEIEHNCSNIKDKQRSETLKKDKIINNGNLNCDFNENINKIEKKADNRSRDNFIGFKTASNNTISVSLKNLTRYKNIFNDIMTQDEEEEVRMDKENKSDLSNSHLTTEVNTIKVLTSEQQSSNKTPKFCFHTASQKPVQVTEESLISSQKVLNKYESKLANNIFQGFKTASNKTINVSKEALEKCKGIFNDIDLEQDQKSNIDYNVNENEGTLNFDEANKFKGFQTASNKNIIVSSEALDTYKTIFKDIDADMDNDLSLNNNTSELNNITQKFDSAITRFKGFSTASNKPVKISKEALAKTKNIFKDLDVDMTDLKKSPEKLHTKPVLSKFKFQTANEKPVDVSEEAITASQRLLCGSINIEKPPPFKFQGFATASNKKVQISKESLARTMKIFDGIDVEFDAHTDTVSNETPDINKSKLLELKKVSNEKNNEPTDTVNSILPKSELESSDVDIKGILNTQVIENLEEALYTEDFLKERTPLQCKRSGSPILSCPKVKKRKFQAPASTKKEINTKITNYSNENENSFEFNANYKKVKNYTLKDLDKFETSHKSSIDVSLSVCSFDSLLEFKFEKDRNDVSNAIWTTDNIKEYFLQSVDRKIVPVGWTENHMKLIMWKLISYEFRFPLHLRNVCTVKNVMEQLKYRYDRELYKVERPALRKVLERDDVSSKALVLCVVGVYVDGRYVSSVTNLTDNIELLLTDGWYTVKAAIDRFLAKLVYDGKLSVGMKIITHGAELINCEQGVAPWEDTSSVRLKIFGNSTRRARWDARLGYHGNGAILSPLSSVKPDGGKVAKLRVYVTRVYPTLYIEKFEDGSTVTRSERLENLYQIKYESDRQMILEKIYEDVEKEFYVVESQDSDGLDADMKLESGTQIAKLMKMHRDPTEFRASLTDTQLQLLQTHTLRQKDKQIEQLQQKVRERIKNGSLGVARNVVPLMKIRVASFEGDSISKAMLSIWRPNEAIQEVISEETWIDVYNVVPTAIRNQEIQLSASRNSVFERCKKKNFEKHNPSTNSLKRRCYPIQDLARNPKVTTDYNEVDTAGIIISIEPSNNEFEKSKQLYQNVFLTDESKNFICINFWGGIKKFGFENLLDTGQVIACVNLQKRSGNTIRNIPQYRSTEYSYFTQTPKYECLRKLSMELVKMISGLDKRKFCLDCVTLKNDLFSKRIPDISPYRFNNSDFNLSKNKNFIDSPINKESLNLSGLDFESSFHAQELSPNKLLRKKELNKRIAKLKFYGEPPPLSSINMIHKSKNVTTPFKSPLTSHNVASANNLEAMCVEKENSNIESSPVLSMKSAKRVGVPVKLDFNKKICERNETVDPFAEEFDASPPLSLD